VLALYQQVQVSVGQHRGGRQQTGMLIYGSWEVGWAGGSRSAMHLTCAGYDPRHSRICVSSVTARPKLLSSEKRSCIALTGTLRVCCLLQATFVAARGAPRHPTKPGVTASHCAFLRRAESLLDLARVLAAAGHLRRSPGRPSPPHQAGCHCQAQCAYLAGRGGVAQQVRGGQLPYD
jgi:hypothetical protein